MTNLWVGAIVLAPLLISGRAYADGVGTILKADEIDSTRVKVGAFAVVVHGLGERRRVSGMWDSLETARGYIQTDRSQDDSLEIENGDAEKGSIYLGHRIANGFRSIRVLGGDKRMALRIPTKVIFGTLLGVAFTAGGFVGIASLDDTAHEDTHAGIGHLIAGGLIGSCIGFPLGVSAVDPYDSSLHTQVFGVIPPIAAGYFLARFSAEMGDVGVPLMYLGPICGSLLASELTRNPPEFSPVSVELFPTFDVGLGFHGWAGGCRIWILGIS